MAAENLHTETKSDYVFITKFNINEDNHNILISLLDNKLLDEKKKLLNNILTEDDIKRTVLKLNEKFVEKEDTNVLLLKLNDEIAGFIYGSSITFTEIFVGDDNPERETMYIANVEIFDKAKNKGLCKDFVKKYIEEVNEKYGVNQFSMNILSLGVENRENDSTIKYISPACLCYIKAFDESGYYVVMNDITNQRNYVKMEDYKSVCSSDNQMYGNKAFFIKKEENPKGGKQRKRLTTLKRRQHKKPQTKKKYKNKKRQLTRKKNKKRTNKK